MPGAVRARVGFPGAIRDFSPRVNFQCRLSYGVSATLRVQSLASESAHVKQTLAAIVRTHKNTGHTGRNGWRCF